MDDEVEQKLLRSVALQNAGSILQARRRAEHDLISAKEALEQRTKQLARTVALLRATLESTTDAVLALDAGGNVIDFNQNFAVMWKVPEAALERRDRRGLLGAMFAEFGDTAAARAEFEMLLGSMVPQSSDVLRLADGRIIERYSKLQVVEESGVGRVWSFRDITASRQAQELLLDEARVLELLNATGEALASELDRETLVQAVTDAATQLSGAKFGAFFYNEMDGRGGSSQLYALSGAPKAAFEKLGQPRPTALLGPTFRGGPPIRSDDVTLDPRYAQTGSGMPEGHLPVRSYLAVSVVSRSGEVIGGLLFGHPQPGVFSERAERIIVGIAAQAAVAIDNARMYESAQRAAAERQELLERERNARATTERTNALKDEFLANLSHELRTPLNAILGWAQMLRLGKRSDEDLEKGLATIERNARMQTQLIDDLLDMSRILAGKVRLDVQPIEPTTFIQAALDTVAPAASAKGIRVERLLDSSAGPILGDANRLQQVMWNLLSNAIKFTAKGGRVQVLLERVNSHIEIGVADTGIGIEREFLPHVFDRFRQADASTTRRHGGLGLGLSIVKHLVELHGGTVRVESPGSGGGTTFSVQMPLPVVHRGISTDLRRHPTAPPPMALEFKALDLSGIKVLVVDDEVDARELVQRVLADCAAEVIIAASAEQALAAIARERPDVLVSDIGMPDVDGFELLRRVRALERKQWGKQGGKVPAVALTAFARSEDRTRALRAGFLVHIAKPIEPSELVATIGSVLGRTEAGAPPESEAGPQR